MKKITITAYTFEELHEDVQERLVKEFRSECCYNDDLEDYLRERLKELTGLSFKLEYSLNNMQGDGLRFMGRIEGDEINKLPFADKVKDAKNTIISINPDGRDYDTCIDIDAREDWDYQEYYDDEWEKLQEALRSTSSPTRRRTVCTSMVHTPSRKRGY